MGGGAWEGSSREKRMQTLTIFNYIYSFIVPAERVRAGDYETGSVRVCVCVSVRVSVRVSVCMCVRAMFNLLLLCHLWTDFDSVCFIWKHYIGASELLHCFSPVTFDLDLWPIFHILLQNATPSPFLTRFRFRLLYVIALGKGFKTSTQNFDLWSLWPLTLIFDLYCIFCYKMLLLRHFRPDFDSVCFMW